MRHLCVTTIMVVFAASGGVTGGEVITTGSLIEEMVDLHRLASFPEPAYRTVQFSSFDHRSTVPGGPGWFANADGFGGEPVPNFEAVLEEPEGDAPGRYLMCDVDGPGAIVRCWTAAIAGSIRVYLDGAEAPVYDGPAEDFLRRPFDVFARQVGLDPAVFDGTFNQQNAAYCPMPFAERCRIEWIGRIKEIHFYQVGIRLYEPGAETATFRPQDLVTYREAIGRVASVLSAPGVQWRYAESDAEIVPIEVTVPAGEKRELLVMDRGSCAIERLTLRVRAGDADRALRQTILSVKCDGWPHGQVESPIGDFFGAAPGINPFDSVPLTVEADGVMTCRFVMPCRDSIRIEAEARGDEPVTITGSVRVIPWVWDDERSMHFRARWRVDHGLTADPKAVRDIPFLVANGKGRYVGTASILMNPTAVPTPWGGWWGEGDEKIFVDGDLTPSTFGTGSEDYFNYAWSIPDIFGWAYCGQPRNDGPGNRGFVTNHRWHVVDSLPFRRRLSFFMELYSHGRVAGFSYARLSYHYARPGTFDDHMAITDDDVRALVLPENWRPEAGLGARNSTFYEPEVVLKGAVGPPYVEFAEGNLYSAGRLMVWRPVRIGQTLAFVVPIAESGKYSVDLCAAKTDQGGTFRAVLRRSGSSGDETVLHDEVDLCAPGRHMLRRISAEPVELEAGEYELVLECAREAGKTIGVDFVWVQRR